MKKIRVAARITFRMIAAVWITANLVENGLHQDESETRFSRPSSERRNGSSSGAFDSHFEAISRNFEALKVQGRGLLPSMSSVPPLKLVEQCNY